MILLKPTLDDQLFSTRCRPHERTGYLFSLDRGVAGVTLVVRDLSYEKGILSGEISLPLESPEQINLRLFDCDPTNDQIISIPEEGEIINVEDWPSKYESIRLAGAIGNDIYRGVILASENKGKLFS